MLRKCQLVCIQNLLILFTILIPIHSRGLLQKLICWVLQINLETKLFVTCKYGWCEVSHISSTFLYIFPKRSCLFQSSHNSRVKTFGVGYYCMPSTFPILFPFFLKISYFKRITRAHLCRYKVSYFVQKEVFNNKPFQCDNSFAKESSLWLCFQLIKAKPTILLLW